MSSLIRCCLIFLVLLRGTCHGAQAQSTAESVQSVAQKSENLETVPRVPGISTLLRGFNAGVTFSGVHNSAISWYSVVTPAVSYSFSRHYSADINASVYFHRLVQNTDPTTQSNQFLITDRAVAGDTLLGFHGFFQPGSFQNTITASVTAPTGETRQGLGTGRVTFDFSNHTEHYYKQFGLLLDLGGGDSSGLFNNLVVKNYNSLGGLAHFQTGAVLWLPGQAYVESVAYEQLPIGDQKIFLNEADRGNQPPYVVSVPSVSEDNGFTTFVGIPLTDYLTLSGYYNRSLRQYSDTVSFGITYVLRGSSRRRNSMIDRALREAERDSK